MWLRYIITFCLFLGVANASVIWNFTIESSTASASLLNDSGSNNHKAYCSGTSFYNGALHFDGINDQCTITNTTARNANFTFNEWVSTNMTSPSAQGGISAKGFNFRKFIISSSNCNVRIITGNASGDDVQHTSIGSICDGERHLITYQYDASVNRSYAYFDCNLVSNLTQQGIESNANNFTFGTDSSGTFFNGSLYSSLFTDDVWTSEQICDYYNQNVDGNGWSANLTFNASLINGYVRSDFWGINAQHAGRSQSLIDLNADGTIDTASNYTEIRLYYLDMNLNILRTDAEFGSLSTDEYTFRTSNGGNYNNISAIKNLVQWAYDNNMTIVFMIGYMPSWLANTSSTICSQSKACPPTNYTKWGILTHSFAVASECGNHTGTCVFQIWNEPDLGQMADTGNATEKADMYVQIFNYSYNALRANSSLNHIKIIGPTLSDVDTSPGSVMLDEFLEHFANKTDGVAWHVYPDGGVGGIISETNTPLNYVIGRISAYGGNVTWLVNTEHGVNDMQVVQNQSQNLYVQAATISYTYLSHGRGGNITALAFKAAALSNFSFSCTTTTYAECPLKREHFSENQLQGLKHANYYSIKNMAAHNPPRGAIINISDTSTNLNCIGNILTSNYLSCINRAGADLYTDITVYNINNPSALIDSMTGASYSYNSSLPGFSRVLINATDVNFFEIQSADCLASYPNNVRVCQRGQPYCYIRENTTCFDTSRMAVAYTCTRAGGCA